MKNARPPATRPRFVSRFTHDFLDPDNPLGRLLDSVGDAVISVDKRRAIILFNKSAEYLFGYSASEARAQPFDLLLSSPVSTIGELHNNIFDNISINSRTTRRELFATRKDGSGFPAEASISKVVFDGEAVFTVIMRDVTERTGDENRVKTSLHNTETSLKEIHHRVKNNLQVVSSLLGLQARSISDVVTRKKLEESQDRIQSMALLHESLYQSEHLAQIEFSEYLKLLAERIFSSHGTGNRIQLRTNLSKIYLHIDAALPCGLIANELLSNAIKYAFPKDRQGEVRIELLSKQGRAVLTIADDGIGLPHDIDWFSSDSLGLRLVQALAQQLQADVSLKLETGTTFVIAFSIANV